MKNLVVLIGRVGNEIETKTLSNEQQAVNFSLATTEHFTNSKGEKVEDTQWHKVVAYGKTAENVGKIVNKGDLIEVEGKIVYRSYEDKDGQKRYITEIVTNSFLLLSKNIEKSN